MRPFAVRHGEQEGLVRAEDLMDALVVARATWPGEQILSVIEAVLPPKARGRPAGVRNGQCGYVDFRKGWRCALKAPHRYVHHSPIAPVVPPREFVPLPPEERAPKKRRPPAIIYEEGDERSRDGVRLCECGEPSLEQQPKTNRSSRACQRCRELEGSFISTSRQDQYSKRSRTGDGRFNQQSDHSPRVLPQIDSRNLGRSLAHFVRDLNRVKPYSQV